MNAEPEPNTEAPAEEAPPGDEVRINRAVRASIAIATALTAVVVAFFVTLEADEPWQFVVYPLLAAVPLVVGIVSARYIRLQQVKLLHGHQARLVMRMIELEKMASHDELTGLYNRRYFYESFQEGLARARLNKQTLALIVLDIDGLKGINDEYGHAVGDIMIASLAKVIEKHIRTSDVPARLGGDEFAVFMPDTDKRGAYALAQRLWLELEEAPMYEHEGISVPLNVSIGVSGFPWGGEDIDEMMHWADADMYANKVSRRLPQSAMTAPQKLTEDPALEEKDWM